MKNNWFAFRKIYLFLAFILFLSFGLSIFFYRNMPDLVATHWDQEGAVNGYMQKSIGVFFMPFLLFILAVVLLAVPRFDPLKKNIEKFEKQYNSFLAVLFLFMLVIHVHTIMWNIGFKINTNIIISASFFPLFYAIGFLCENSKRNWSIGVRTSWTLSSDVVWDKTNKLAGKMFKASGILSLIGIIFSDYSIYFMLAPIIFSSIFVSIYSYVIFKKSQKQKQ
ncbi:MAG: SdpI family protein [archaeon]